MANGNWRALFLLLIIYLGFISLGLPDGSLGVAWPGMYPELQLPIGSLGALMVLITVLSGISGFSSGRIIARFGTGPVVLASCAATGSALMMISHASGLAWLLLATVPLGFGAGAVDAGLNGYVARHFSGRQMNWLHACWGVGASLGPIIMGTAIAQGSGWRSGYAVIATAQLSLATIFLCTLGLWRTVPERRIQNLNTDGVPPKSGKMRANSFAGWLSVAIFMIYTSVEATAGLWAASILMVGRGMPTDVAAGSAAAFYGAITVGRIGAGVIVDRLGNRRVIACSGLLALGGAVLFAFANSAVPAATALILLGLGFAPIYPCLMHEVPRRFVAEDAQIVIGRQSGAGAIGMALLPAIAGWIASLSLEAITWALIAGVLLLLTAIRRLNRIA
jgi:Major Facilitator Superfamily.